jgi:hypothetical protein
MASSGFEVIAAAIDENLDHLHKQLWEERAAELHGAEAEADGADRERIQQELREHYAARFQPETSRDVLMAQARQNYEERRSA